MIQHRSICALVNNNIYAEITPADVIAQVSNFSFDAYTFECWGALTTGAQLSILQKSTLLDVREFAAALKNEKITALFCTTAIFNQHVRDFPAVFEGLRTVLYGGEDIDHSGSYDLAASPSSPRHLQHVYGPTETTTFATFYAVPADAERSSSMPIGRPIANTEVFVLDRFGGL
ncbi:AMP-binding protein, partial [Acrocarpospora corrugata]|uniref:AMP-binding protein n=1 Tax=Acrocarpospora corrugata TaxID=35763 RepID=UPI0031CDEF31